MIKLEDLHKYIGKDVYYEKIIPIKSDIIWSIGTSVVGKLRISKIEIGEKKNPYSGDRAKIYFDDQDMFSLTESKIYATEEEAMEVCVLPAIEKNIEFYEGIVQSLKKHKQEIENEKHIGKH